jgi:metal-responsive CopG/Arc/MetJ family transcriptional regulator
MRRWAISLPDDLADAMERLRRKERIPRSRLIQRAIALYLSERGRYQAIRAYEDGYRRIPEGTEAEAYAQAAAQVLEEEDWE